MSKHTPTPWTVETGDGYLAIRASDGNAVHYNERYYPSGVSREDMDFIVQAVNAYYPAQELIGELVEALLWIHNNPKESNASVWDRASIALSLAREHGYGVEE